MKVSKTYNPLALQKSLIFSEVNESLSPNDLAKLYEIDIRSQPVILNINGQWIDRKYWNDPIPADAVVYFVALPRGGNDRGSNTVLAVIATIVVLVASYYVGPWVTGSLKYIWGPTLAGYAGSLASAVVAVGGMLLVNQFFGMTPIAATSLGGEDGSLTSRYSLTASRNTIALGQPFPEHVGRYICFPNLIMAAYTRFVDNEQYLFMLGVIGVGEYDIEGVFVDKTPIGDYDEAEYRIYQPGKNPTTEEGFSPVLVWVSGETMGQELTTEWKSFVVEPRGVRTTYLEIDLVFPSGLIHSNTDGSVSTQDVEVISEYCLVDDAGDETGGWQTLASKTYSASSREIIRDTIRTGGIDPGRHKMRIKRGNEKSTDIYTVDGVTLQAVKAYGPGHPDYGNVTLFEAKLKATDQLSSDAASRINVIATRKLPILTETGLSETMTATRNPIDIACYIVTSENGGKQAESILDVDSLYELRQLAVANGITFDHRFTSRLSVMEACALVARLLRAIPILPGGLFTLVRDEPQAAPSQIFTDDDISEGTLSIAHTYRTADSSTCVQVEYVNGTSFESETVDCLDEFGSLDNPATIQLTGCTDRQLAYEIGMYMYLDDRYGRSNVTYTTGLKGYLPLIGRAVAVASNSIGWGQHGFLKAINGTNIWLSHPVDFGPDNTEGVLRAINTEAGVTSEINVTKTEYDSCVSGMLSGVYTEEDEGHRPSLYVFGTSLAAVENIRVVKIQPQDQKSVRINGTIIHPEVYADPGEAPAFGYVYPTLKLLEWVDIEYRGIDGSDYQFYARWNGSAPSYRFEVWNGSSYDIIEDEYGYKADLYETTEKSVQVRVTPYDDGAVLQTGDAIVQTFALPDAPATVSATTAVNEKGILVSWGSVAAADAYEMVIVRDSATIFRDKYTDTSKRFYIADIRAMMPIPQPWTGEVLTVRVRALAANAFSAWVDTTIDLTVPQPINNLTVYNSTDTQVSFTGISPGAVAAGYSVDGFTVLSGPFCHEVELGAWKHAMNLAGSDSTVSGTLDYANCYEGDFPYSFAVAAYYSGMKAVDFLDFQGRYLVAESGVHHQPDPKYIDRNLTIYCAPPGGDGDYVGDNSLAEALYWLGDYRIPNKHTVTIQSANGVYGASSGVDPIVITHQDCNNLIIRGNSGAATTINIASAANAPNPTNDFIYIPASAFSVNDFKDASANNYVVYVVGSTGNDGGFIVSAADLVGSDIRLTMLSFAYWYARPTAVLDSTKDGVLYLPSANPCQLVFKEATVPAILHNGNGALRIYGLHLVGDTVTGRPGIKCENGETIICNNILTSGKIGCLQALNGSKIQVPATGFSETVVGVGHESGGGGINAATGSTISCNYVISSGGSYGFSASRSSSVDASHAISSRNQGGFGSYTSAGLTATMARSYNNDIGCQEINGGYIERAGITNSGNVQDYDPTGTPPIEGVDGGWIR